MGSGKTAAVINMTPMIDILLVLLITFMLLPARTKGLPSELPEPAPDNQPSAPNSLDSVLRIRKDREVCFSSMAPQIWSMPTLRRRSISRAGRAGSGLAY
jgi:biopolymer transport protein ExbD